MKKALFLSVALLVVLSWATMPAAQSRPAEQITHTPLGSGSIAPAVVVRGLVPTRSAGVSSDIAGARHWSARVRGVPTSLNFGTTLTVRGGTESGPVKTLSSMVIKERRLSPAGAPKEQARFALTFTPKMLSPTYRLEIWNGGTRVFEVVGLKTGGTVLAGNDPICDAIGKIESVALGICYFTIGTCSELDDQGRFTWTIHRQAPVPWVIPALSPDAVVGDQLRIVEETPSSPGPIVFKNATVQGTSLSEMVLMDEMATATVPDSHKPGR